MNISVTHGDALRHEAPLLALCAWEDEPLAPSIAGLIENGDWSGKFKQTTLLYPRGAVPAKRVLLVGMGKRAQANADRLREAGALAAQRANDLKLDHYTFELPTLKEPTPADTAQAIVEGSLLGMYRFQEYKTDLDADQRHTIGGLTLLASVADEAITRGAMLGEMIARGVALTRDLANRPGNDVTPTRLGEVAQAIGARFHMPVTVLGPDELKAQGFGGLLGVGQGSREPSRFIIMEHGANLTDAPTICLVGKGITFDTGGISIKPSDSMELMKMDMSGAATVLGAMQVVGELNLPLHVVGLISAAENMPSSTAYKPGDILKTLSGKTIEVINTDAEGRVVLADALFYAQRYHPAAIIDLATLTGAVQIALGAYAIGLMGNDDGVAGRILQAGEESGERAWRLPLWDQYIEMVKSDVADVKNSAGRYAGAITGAAFLSHFVGDHPWVHLDIAGAAMLDQKKAYMSKGATGVGVRLLVQALRGWAEERS